jgi:hypothetical protein
MQIHRYITTERFDAYAWQCLEANPRSSLR